MENVKIQKKNALHNIRNIVYNSRFGVIYLDEGCEAAWTTRDSLFWKYFPVNKTGGFDWLYECTAESNGRRLYVSAKKEDESFGRCRLTLEIVRCISHEPMLHKLCEPSWLVVLWNKDVWRRKAGQCTARIFQRVYATANIAQEATSHVQHCSWFIYPPTTTLSLPQHSTFALYSFNFRSLCTNTCKLWHEVVGSGYRCGLR